MIKFGYSWVIFLFIGISFSCSDSAEKTLVKYIEASQSNNVEKIKSILNESKNDLAFYNALLAHSYNNEFLDSTITNHTLVHPDNYNFFNAKSLRRIDEDIEKLTDQSFEQKWFRFENKIFLINQLINSKRQHSIPYSSIESIKDQKWKHDKLNHYSYLKYLYFYSKKLKDQGNNSKALSHLNYGLYYIEKHNLNSDFSQIEFDLRLSIVITIESDPNYDKYEDYLNWQLNKLKKISNNSTNNQFLLDYCKLNHPYYDNINNIKTDILLHLEQKYACSNISAYKKINLLSSLLKKWVKIDCSKYQQIFEKISKIRIETQCNFYIFHNLLEARTKEFNKDIFEKLSAQIESFENCFEQYPYFEYVYHFYLDNPTNSSEKKIQNLLRQRQLAEELFGTKPSLHIQDLYAYNTNNIFSQLLKMNNQEINQYEKRVLDLIYQTKAIELKRNRFIDENNRYALQSKSDLNQKIKETNDFIDINYDSNEIYESIFKLEHVISETSEKQFDEINYRSLDSLNTEKLIKKIAKTNSTLINILKYGPNYWFYIRNKKQFILKKIDVTETDSLLIHLNEQINSENVLDETLSALKKLINIKIQNDRQVVIFADGEFLQFPFELIFNTEPEIQYHFNMNQWLNEDKLNLKSSHLHIFSYSDNNTINKTTKREVRELSFGFKEAKEIHKIFNNRSSLITGSKFNKNTLKDIPPEDIIHLNTHAGVNLENRLGSYILARDFDENPFKLYSYQIENWNLGRKVVVLSACDTGVGVFKVGVGSYSISRAFFFSGSETVIKSLWPVNEKATSIFMKEFYANCNLGYNIATALKLSKQMLKKHSKYSHPYYWAGFVIEGNNNVII